MSDQTTELERLRAENAELQRRLAEIGGTIDTLRDEALERRAEIRRLAEELPTAMSRRVLLGQMMRDVTHHPDKAGMLRRAVAKLGRAPRKALRSVRSRLGPRPEAP